MSGASPGRSSERRLVLVISAVMFVDTMFFAVIAPLLPTLSHELHLTKLSAGLLTASYPVGTLLGSLPGGIVAARVGPRPTVITGLVLLALSTAAFAVLADAAALDAARLIEGVGGAFLWAGGLAWVASESPIERRGALIGRTVSAAIAGALFGPVIGTLAGAVGRPLAFGAVILAAGVLIDACRRLPSAHVPAEQGLSDLRSALTRPGIPSGMWLVALPALTAGVMTVLAPLRLHHLGASTAVIGATFLLAAGAEAWVSPAVGALSDRRGRLLPLRLGLLLASVLLVAFTVPRSATALVVLVIAILAAPGVFWAPAMAMLSDAAEAHCLDQGLAAALMNLAWAAGESLGSGVGGPLASASGDRLPTALAAGLCLGSLLVVGRRRSRAAIAAAPPG